MSSVNGFVDIDYVEDLDRRRFQTSYVYTILKNVIKCKETLQHIVVLSTIESKYITLIASIKEAL